MRQGNDIGTQYRSGIYTDGAEQQRRGGLARRLCRGPQVQGVRRDHDRDRAAGDFYYAEDYHQQYLAKNPNGYCGLGGTGVACPTGLAAAAG
jgi:peptide-methionine (S)-S-oxide reductase